MLKWLSPTQTGTVNCLKIGPHVYLEQDRIDRSADMPGTCPSVPAVITGYGQSYES